MPYVAARRMTASGKVFEPGDVVPLAAIPPRVRTALLNTRRLHEVDEAGAKAAQHRARQRTAGKG